MAKFYGNVNNDPKTNLVFDRMYPSWAAMRAAADKDGVAIGRFVLVKYDALMTTENYPPKGPYIEVESRDGEPLNEETSVFVKAVGEEEITSGSILKIGEDYWLVTSAETAEEGYVKVKCVDAKEYTSKLYEENYNKDKEEFGEKFPKSGFDATI